MLSFTTIACNKISADVAVKWTKKRSSNDLACSCLLRFNMQAKQFSSSSLCRGIFGGHEVDNFLNVCFVYILLDGIKVNLEQ